MAEEHHSSPTLLQRLRAALAGANTSGEFGVNGLNGAPALNGNDEKDRVEASRARLLNAARFDTLSVVDVMIPRADIAALDVTTPLSDIMAEFRSGGHSRMPVYRDSLDEPLGLAHIRDLLPFLSPAPDSDAPSPDEEVLPRIVRKILYAPPSMPAAALLLKMQTSRIHMALVVDEFGGTDGLVTLEDLVEEIVGEIEDEHDASGTPDFRTRGPAVLEANARAEISDLEARIHRDLSLPDTAEEVDTLGGLVFTLAGRVPSHGEVITHPAGLEFEVIDADPRRIKRLLVRVKDRNRRVHGEGEDA